MVDGFLSVPLTSPSLSLSSYNRARGVDPFLFHDFMISCSPSFFLTLPHDQGYLFSSLRVSQPQFVWKAEGFQR
jgi:hypothetical protein